MAKNKVQFQKGMSLSEFMDQFGNEAKCQKALFKLRWPDGFRCPECDHRSHCRLKARKIIQCHRCHHQASLTARTIFASTKLPLRTWFLALYLLTQGKSGLSAMAPKRQLGVSCNTAYLIKQKLMQTMRERDDSKPLSGAIQLDDAFWGGERRNGKRGRGAPGKPPFVAAVACDQRGRPLRMRLTSVKTFSRCSILNWARRHLSADSEVVSDALPCFRVITEVCPHWSIITGGGPASVEAAEFHWVNTMLGNIKNALRGTYHAVRAKHLGRYLGAFAYRFNRRFQLERMVDRLAYVACRTPPLPYRLAKLAEVHG